MAADLTTTLAQLVQGLSYASSNLAVAGDAAFTKSGSNAGAAVSVTNTNAGLNAFSRFYATNGTHGLILQQYGIGTTTSTIFRGDGGIVFTDGAGGLTLATGAAQPIYFAVNSAEVARMTAKDFGYGVIPPASDNPAMHWYGGGTLYSNSVSNDMRLGCNVYIASGTNLYKTTNTASVYQQSGGEHIWSTAASGSSNSPISFTQSMRLDTGGHLLVGFSSSQGGYALQVNSQIYATNATIATSDLTLKDLREPASPEFLSAVGGIPTILYTRKDQPEAGLRAGYGAQHWQKVLSDHGYADSGIVVKMNDDTLALDEGAAQALKIASLEARVNYLEKKLESK